MTTKEALEEICLEKARFLLNVEEILEQTLEDNDGIIPNPIYQENNISIDTNIPLVF